jgi:hypothetical protein
VHTTDIQQLAESELSRKLVQALDAEESKGNEDDDARRWLTQRHKSHNYSRTTSNMHKTVCTSENMIAVAERGRPRRFKRACRRHTCDALEWSMLHILTSA